MAKNQIITHGITASATAVIAIAAILTFFVPAEQEISLKLDIIVDHPSSLNIESILNEKTSDSHPDNIATISIIKETFQRPDIKDPINYITTNILTSDSASAEGWEYVGDVQFENEEYIDALASYNLADAIVKNNIHVLNKIGSTYFIGEDGKSALEYYEKALTIDNSYLPSLTNAAFLHALDGNHEKATEYFERGMDISADHGPLLSNYALFLALTGNYDQSQKIYKRISILHPDISEFLANQKVVQAMYNANMLKESNRVDLFIKENHIQLAVNIAFFEGDLLRKVHTEITFQGSFDDLDSMIVYGNRLQNAKLYQLSEWYFLRTLEKDPENLVARVGIAYTYDLANKLDDAMKHYKIVLDTYPDHVGANNGIANVFLKKDNFEYSREYYNIVLAEFPGNINARLGLGNVELEQGAHKKALEKYEEVLHESPDHINANKAAANAHFHSKNYVQADHYYQKVLGLTNDNDPDAMWGRGISLHFLGETHLSQEYFTRYQQHNADLVKQLNEVLLTYPEESEIAKELRDAIKLINNK